jgi:DNA-binding LacI/PurR family transcriptional regulator
MSAVKTRRFEMAYRLRRALIDQDHDRHACHDAPASSFRQRPHRRGLQPGYRAAGATCDLQISSEIHIGKYGSCTLGRDKTSIHASELVWAIALSAMLAKIAIGI